MEVACPGVAAVLSRLRHAAGCQPASCNRGSRRSSAWREAMPENSGGAKARVRGNDESLQPWGCGGWWR
ncbi:hypothetical protein E2562_016485 [Oryza meyeriana var. granulata]|uniref:Uncharacterized protein n=1 Tax=Oryza meyeriana var. granulata TaxID=110450 RepID=A0A6G1BL56_9ORYZ|nr:hypothetical protein E2562_016485 [Oryza meyeriana var. granulata]